MGIEHQKRERTVEDEVRVLVCDGCGRFEEMPEPLSPHRKSPPIEETWIRLLPGDGDMLTFDTWPCLEKYASAIPGCKDAANPLCECPTCREARMYNRLKQDAKDKGYPYG